MSNRKFFLLVSRLSQYLRRNARLLCMVTLCINTALANDLLNVSYDPTRELYKAYNTAFISYWQQKTGQSVNISMSHGGSGKQVRSVIDGLQADVVTLALAADIDALNSQKPMLDKNWQTKFPHNSTPYTSTIIFLVRKGNPKQIKDWDDLVRENVEVITANPKTSGGARWSFLAAWAFAKQRYGSDDKAFAYVTELFRHVPVLDTGTRGSTISFVQRGLGDVLIAWENEAHLALTEQGGDELEIVMPSSSILAEPSVAIVDEVVDRKGTRELATAYINYLYSDEAQHIIAKSFYRPTNEKILNQYAQQFPKINLVTIDDFFGGWAAAQKKYFDDAGVFDAVYTEIYQ